MEKHTYVCRRRRHSDRYQHGVAITLQRRCVQNVPEKLNMLSLGYRFSKIFRLQYLNGFAQRRMLGEILLRKIICPFVVKSNPR